MKEETKEINLQEAIKADREKRIKQAKAIFDEAVKKIEELNCYIEPAVALTQSQGVVGQIIINSK